jgi:hypothetical protein
MGKTLTIRLDSEDLGQLLDGLRCRAEAWHGTAEYMETGYSARDDFVVEECSDAEEARAIAAHYDRIISSIEEQVAVQEEKQ